MRKIFAKINRRALVSGFTIAATSTTFSPFLLLPLIFLPVTYSVTASLSLGILLLLFLGAFRGKMLKQSPIKSAVKMLLLGILIIFASRGLGGFVEKLLSVH